jgi:hypothetical protein
MHFLAGFGSWHGMVWEGALARRHGGKGRREIEGRMQSDKVELSD